jgi:predicted DNA-binding protein (MmcQ/YjbR family)
MAKQNPLKRAEARLRAAALAFPESYEEFPWGHTAVKVQGKVFLFLYREKTFLSLSLKLPVSGKTAVGLPFASPTPYALGKSSWVTARFNVMDHVPLEMLQEWLDESFRAIAPKRILARLEAAGEENQSAKASPRKLSKRRSKRTAR